MSSNCVICIELFAQSDVVCVTQCGHIFHYPCLQEWLRRSPTCPHCRKQCWQKDIHRIYFNSIDVGTLKKKLENVEQINKISEKKLEKAHEEIQELRNTISDLKKNVPQFNEQINILKTQNTDLKSQIAALKRELSISERKKTKMQDDLRKAKTKLEKRIVQLESENYRLIEQSEEQKENRQTARLQQQTNNIRLLASTNTPSPSLYSILQNNTATYIDLTRGPDNEQVIIID